MRSAAHDHRAPHPSRAYQCPHNGHCADTSERLSGGHSRRGSMITRVTYLAAALFIASCPPICAQDTRQPKLTQADLKAITDARVGILKAALQLNPEQQKYWPALEEAIRARARDRDQRIAALAERRGQGGPIEPVEIL